jgi:hypothetical protein
MKNTPSWLEEWAAGVNRESIENHIPKSNQRFEAILKLHDAQKSGDNIYENNGHLTLCNIDFQVLGCTCKSVLETIAVIKREVRSVADDIIKKTNKK